MSKTKRIITIVLDICLLISILVGIIIPIINPVEYGYSTLLYFAIYVNGLLFVTTIIVLISLFKDSDRNINNTAYILKYIATVSEILLFFTVFFIFVASLSIADDGHNKIEIVKEFFNGFILDNALLLLVSPILAYITTFKLERHDVDLKWYHCLEAIIPGIFFIIIHVYKTLYATNKWVDGLNIIDEDFLLKVDPVFLGFFLFVYVVISFILKGIANDNYQKSKKELIIDITLLVGWIFAFIITIKLNNVLPLEIILLVTVIAKIYLYNQNLKKRVGGGRRGRGYDEYYSSSSTNNSSNTDFIDYLYEDSKKNFEPKEEPQMSYAEREEKEYWDYVSYNKKDDDYY